jgi:hypothetical protein
MKSELFDTHPGFLSERERKHILNIRARQRVAISRGLECWPRRPVVEVVLDLLVRYRMFMLVDHWRSDVLLV